MNTLHPATNAQTNENKQSRLTLRQLELLKFIYAYRFVTTKQVQLFLGKRQVQQAQQRLNTLLTKDYIGRKFIAEDRLLGNYAAYFLLPDGIKILGSYGHPRALRNIYKDALASERFMKHCVAIGDVESDLRRTYHDAKEMRFFTKSELMRCDGDDGSDEHEPYYASLPQPLPDLYLEHTTSDDNYCTYLIEVWHSTVPFWVYRKRIKSYIEYVDDGSCATAFGDTMLPVLLICDNPKLQQRVLQHLRRISDELDDNLRFLVTNQQILATANTDAGIWTIVSNRGSKTLKLNEVPGNL